MSPGARGRTGLAAVALSVVAACSGAADDDGTRVAVEVASHPCATPNRRLGVGVFVGDGLVLTAAHVVDGDVRDVTVDGRPGEVVAVDVRLDAALVATTRADDVAVATLVPTVAAGPVVVATPAGELTATVERRIELTVDDTTARQRHRRRTIVLDTAVAEGTSGAPVIGTDGGIVGLVTLTRPGASTTYATDASELEALVAAHDRSGVTLDRRRGCS